MPPVIDLGFEPSGVRLAVVSCRVWARCTDGGGPGKSNEFRTFEISKFGFFFESFFLSLKP